MLSLKNLQVDNYAKQDALGRTKKRNSYSLKTGRGEITVVDNLAIRGQE
jgi:hypothetical protein